MAEKNHKLHAIMISFPFQGHVNPFINLAIKLASNGIIVTFAHMEHIHQSIHQARSSTGTQVDLFAEARESGLDIRYTTISDGFPVEFDRSQDLDEYWESILQNFPSLVEEFVEKIVKSDPSLASFLVADTYYAWPTRVAKKYNLVNVSVWTEPAMVFAICSSLDLLRENGHFPPKDNVEDIITYIPGVHSISTRDLMSFVTEATDGGKPSVTKRNVCSVFQGVKKADFVLSNTVQELEQETLSALQKEQPNYAIGPVNFFNDFTKVKVPKSLLPESKSVMSWLSSKPHGSVLYVSFGSFCLTSKEVIEEVAYGLMLSEVNFIWVVRDNVVDSKDSDVFPSGFLDGTKDRGLIVQWCDQYNVLSNPAVGGFLTHCGWNSILESTWCGVPMICYPLLYDQPTNRKLVVDDWKIGVNLLDRDVITRDETTEKIKSLMSGETSKELRQEIKKLRTIMQDAVTIDGSSERNFDQFLTDLKAKAIKQGS